MTEPLDQLGDTCRAVLHAEAALQSARDVRDRLLVQVRDAGVPARQVGEVCRRRLLDEGWPPELVGSRAVGLSDGNVRRVLDHPR